MNLIDLLARNVNALRSENCHSQIIGVLLNDPDFLGCFVRMMKNKTQLMNNPHLSSLLTDIKNSCKNIVCKDFVVDIESGGRIDILVRDNKKRWVIIVENKFYNAPDQDRQIPRYIAKMRKEKYERIVVAYLKAKESSFPEKTGWTQVDISNVEAVLVPLSFAGDGDACSLINAWIGEMTKRRKDCEIVLSQYREYIEDEIKRRDIIIGKNPKVDSKEKRGSKLSAFENYVLNDLILRNIRLQPFQRKVFYHGEVAAYSDWKLNVGCRIVNMALDVRKRGAGFSVEIFVWSPGAFDRSELDVILSTVREVVGFEEYKIMNRTNPRIYKRWKIDSVRTDESQFIKEVQSVFWVLDLKQKKLECQINEKIQNKGK